MQNKLHYTLILKPFIFRKAIFLFRFRSCDYRRIEIILLTHFK